MEKLGVIKETRLTRRSLLLGAIAMAAVLARTAPAQQAPEPPARVTIVYDAFGTTSTLKRGWGYSALVEYAGKRVLFDTGGDHDDFAFNVKSLAIDLRRLDFVVLTHRHGDHTMMQM